MPLFGLHRDCAEPGEFSRACRRRVCHAVAQHHVRNVAINWVCDDFVNDVSRLTLRRFLPEIRLKLVISASFSGCPTTLACRLTLASGLPCY